VQFEIHIYGTEAFVCTPVFRTWLLSWRALWCSPWECFRSCEEANKGKIGKYSENKRKLTMYMFLTITSIVFRRPKIYSHVSCSIRIMKSHILVEQEVQYHTPSGIHKSM